MHRSLSCLLLVGLAVASAPAVDDLRLTYHKGSEDFTFAPPSIGDEVEKNWDDSTRYEIGLWNVVIGRSSWGIAGIKHEADFSDERFTLEYESMGGRLYFAQAYAFSQSLQLEFQSFLGWSRTEVDVRGGGESHEDNSWMYEYGVIAEVVFCSNPRSGLLVGAGGGYLFSESDFEIDGDREIGQEGWGFCGTVGWRF